jgi:enoyl-CoA hydratase/carnithine racemase
MLPAAGGTRSITSWTTPARALPLVLSGEPITADAAQRLGIIDRVLREGEDVEDAARSLARRLAALPQASVRSALAALTAARELPLPLGLEVERRLAYLTERFNSD